MTQQNAPANDYRLEAHPKFEFLQIQPTPTQEEIASFYAQEFYSQEYPGFNNSALEVQLDDLEFHQAHFQDLCDSFSSLLERPLDSMSVLDIGCGWGQALLHFQDQGMAAYGFDPAPEAVEYGERNGLQVVQAGMDNMNVFDGRRFDVVTLLNVLEHLADPVGILTEIKDKVLNPGGIIAIEVPNEFNAFQVAGKEAHDLKEWWVAPPAHLNYFTRTTLSELLTGIGYEVKITESSFPMEMFLVFGDNYVEDPAVGKACHKKRVAFEMNLRRQGKTEFLRSFYRSMADQNLGRQVLAFAQA